MVITHASPENHIGKCLFLMTSGEKVISVPILLRVSCVLVSVTKLWHMILHLCICEGHTCHAKVLDSKLSSQTTKEVDIVVPVTVQWESENYIRGKIYKQNVIQWCHVRHRRSGQWATRTCMNDNHYSAFIRASNCTTLHSDLVHMVEILKIAYCMAWKSSRTSLMRKGEEVGLYISKTSGWVYLL